MRSAVCVCVLLAPSVCLCPWIRPHLTCPGPFPRALDADSRHTPALPNCLRKTKTLRPYYHSRMAHTILLGARSAALKALRGATAHEVNQAPVSAPSCSFAAASPKGEGEATIERSVLRHVRVSGGTASGNALRTTPG